MTAPETIVGPVRFEHLDHPLGAGTARPRLSWQVRTDDPDWAQAAYELESGGVVVRVESAEQVLVPWPFEPLTSRARASVRVRVAPGMPGTAWSDWSEPAEVEAGLLSPADWSARFISPRDVGGAGEPAPVLARTVSVRAPVAAARLYATAHGVYEATINGERVGDHVLAPGWTSYAHRLRYQTHDVTDLVREGDNAVEVLLGNGWFRGRLGWTGGRARYGDRLALLAQLEVSYADGTREVFGTGEEWSAGESEILHDDLYDGQRTDLRGARTAGGAVDVLDDDVACLSRLIAPEGPPVRVTEVLPAASVTRSPSGRTIVDFGQNLVGWVRLRVRDGHEGAEVTVRHAEVLEDGELAVRPLRSAKATDGYILAGDGEVTLEPRFTFHGFRYAEVSGTEDFAAEAVVIGSGLRRTGWFACSEPEVERLHDNVVWSMRGNFVDIPTDCPQRDERLGWTGDIQVFSPTASFLHDSAGFLSSWLRDLAAEQSPDGGVPFVIPDVLSGTGEFEPGQEGAAAAWGDAATVVPWVLYQRFGDAEVLRTQLPSMKAWVDKVASLTTGGVWAGGFQFGDWLDPTAPPDNPFAAKADSDVVATAHLARSARIVAEAARVLGEDDDAERYAKLAERTRAAFEAEYVTPAGRILSDAPTVYALALCWDLLGTDTQREHATRRLAELVRAGEFRISTGFVGTPLITDALAGNGCPELAYRLLLERSCPSWLYPVTMGATTIWERWDSLLPDGSVNPGEMTSFNHYALGAVADWLHRTVAGLAPAEPGYRKLMVRPRPGGGLTHASARHLTPYGEASVAWRVEDGTCTLHVVVPPGSRAEVHVPGGHLVEVGHGRHTFSGQPRPASGDPAIRA